MDKRRPHARGAGHAGHATHSAWHRFACQCVRRRAAALGRCTAWTGPDDVPRVRGMRRHAAACARFLSRHRNSDLPQPKWDRLRPRAPRAGWAEGGFGNLERAARQNGTERHSRAYGRPALPRRGHGQPRRRAARLMTADGSRSQPMAADRSIMVKFWRGLYIMAADGTHHTSHHSPSCSPFDCRPPSTRQPWARSVSCGYSWYNEYTSGEVI